MSNNDNQRIAIPTVDQIAKDAITQIAHRFWSEQDATKPLEPFDPNLIEDIYLNELLKTNFSLRRIMLLEFSQYLENYLWKNFQSDQTTKAHLLSIVIMVNEKFRERVFAWDCFRTYNQSEFPAFFTSILHLCLDKSTQGQPYQLSYQEHSILIKFLDNCINSLEVEIVRLQVQKICGFPMWASVCENRRDFEFKQFPKLKKYWKAIQKQDQKLSQTELDKVNFERFFFKNLINKFLKVISNCPKQEDGQLDEDFKYSTNYLERFIELLVDIESLLPTRRFFNTLLDDTNLLSHCCLSDMVKNSDQKYNLFKQLFEMLKFYVKFEIDDQTGEAKTEPQVLEYHYNKLKSLQRGVFKYFREDLLTFSLTNISTIDKRDTLLKHLSGLSNDRLYSLAEYLHLVPSRESIQDLEYSSEFLIEVIVWHMQLRDSQLDVLNSMPLYPTEDIIWNETLVPSDFRQTTFHDTCLALPKLNLQFLTLNDYLMRNFNLFRLEAAYELRQDIEDACIRLKPYYSFEEQTVCFGAWSRMAQPIANFTLTEVGSPNVGEQAPSRVKADVTLDLDFLREDVRKEWESLRKHDIGFLVTLRPTFSKEQKYDPKDSFLRQMGLLCVRGCEIEGMLGPEGKLIEEGPMYSKPKFTDASRTYRVHLDRNQYKIDNEKFVATKSKEDLYTTFNVFIRRRPKENNFKSILESIRDLMNTNFVVPDWLSDLLLGYGEPNQAHYRSLKKPEPIPTLDFYDTFLDYDHLKASFPGYQLVLKDGQFSAPFRLSFEDLKEDINEKKIIVEPYVPINRGPYPKNIPKKNQVKFTPTQIEAIKSGMQPGLTMVVGPPGTGKTDVAVQIISNIYHNFPNQKTLIVTHSNQALNQIFEKIMHLDIDERHLLRLGHGEEQLETEKDFSRYGRVNFILAKRLELLDEVDRLQKTFDDVLSDSAAYSCETASHFYTNYIQPKWESYMIKIQKLIDQNDSSIVENVENLFPFGNFFSNAPQPLFKKESWQKDLEISKGCFRYLKRMFKQLDEFRAFELIRSGADRAEYLLVKEAKIIAMTCTHAALRRRDLVKMNFRYDNILMEEAAQILEIETFIPLLLQDPDHNGNNRLKRWIMIGDHNQLPPVIKNQTFQKYSNMEQSLFTRFVKLGIPTVDLDAQGRSRSSLCELFSWRYKNLGSLSHVNERDEFRKANTGFKFDYQLINVEDFNGVGESEPQPFFYQNLAEAEYLVAVFMYMRMIGYPGEKITILSTYNGQKHLIRDVLRKRCANNPIIGLPRKITTVDKYQGQQNDYILLSLVKTRNVGHLRDVRRLIVAMSRARLGLYIFCRCQLFRSCYELTPVFNILTQRPTKLCMLPSEFFPTERMLSDEVNGGSMVVNDMPEMTQFVFDFYKSRLEAWKKNKREMEIVQQRLLQEERIRKLDEEEKVLREKLEVAAEKISRTERLRIQEDESSSEESENEDQAEINEVKSAENEEKNQDDRSQGGNTDENEDNRQTEMAAEQAEADEETIEDKTNQAEDTNVVNDHSEMVVEQNDTIQEENDVTSDQQKME